MLYYSMLYYIILYYSRSDGQVVSVADCSVNDLGSLPTRDTDCRFSEQCKVIELALSMMPFARPTAVRHLYRQFGKNC